MNSVTVDTVYGHDPDMDEVARLSGEEPDHAGSSAIGEEAPETSGADQRAAGRLAASRKATKSNIPLYAGVGLVALLMAGGYLDLRPATAPHPVLATQSAATIPAIPPGVPAPLAPAAALANVPLPHLPLTVLHQKYIPQPPSAELSELDSFRAGTLGNNPAIPPPLAAFGTSEIAGQHGPAPQAPARPRTPAGIAAPGSGEEASGGLQAARSSADPHHLAGASAGHPSPPGSPVTAVNALAHQVPLVVATAVGAKPGNLPALRPNATTMRIPHPSAAPGSVAAVTQGAGATGQARTGASIAAAQAGTLSPAQQTSLYQLVTQLGTLVRNDEIRQAALAGQVQQLTLMMSGKMADYDRRLSMLEAQTAVSGAVQAVSNTALSSAIGAAPAPAAPVLTSSAPAAASMAATSPARPAALPASGAAVAVRYHVQAASPGLAMLSAAGGDGSPLEVQTGDIIPGYGRVLGVVQQGDSWVVQTQSGNIE